MKKRNEIITGLLDRLAKECDIINQNVLDNNNKPTFFRCRQNDIPSKEMDDLISQAKNIIKNKKLEFMYSAIHRDNESDITICIYKYEFQKHIYLKALRCNNDHLLRDYLLCTLDKASDGAIQHYLCENVGIDIVDAKKDGIDFVSL